jgi:hypothetical protein
MPLSKWVDFCVPIWIIRCLGGILDLLRLGEIPPAGGNRACSSSGTIPAIDQHVRLPAMRRTEVVVPIRLPANYVPGFNIFVSYDGESAQPVNYMNPLPVRASYIAPNTGPIPVSTPAPMMRLNSRSPPHRAAHRRPSAAWTAAPHGRFGKCPTKTATPIPA